MRILRRQKAPQLIIYIYIEILNSSVKSVIQSHVLFSFTSGLITGYSVIRTIRVVVIRLKIPLKIT